MNDAKASTELLPKPRREDYPCACQFYFEGPCLSCREFKDKNIEYYKRLAEFAIASMKDANKDKLNTHFILKEALSTIKGSQS